MKTFMKKTTSLLLALSIGTTPYYADAAANTSDQSKRVTSTSDTTVVTTPAPTPAPATSVALTDAQCRIRDSVNNKCPCDGGWIELEDQCITQSEYNGYLSMSAGGQAAYTPMCQESALKKMHEENFDSIINPQGTAVVVYKKISSKSVNALTDYIDKTVEKIAGDQSPLLVSHLATRKTVLCEVLMDKFLPPDGKGDSDLQSKSFASANLNNILAFVDSNPVMEQYFPSDKNGECFVKKDATATETSDVCKTQSAPKISETLEDLRGKGDKGEVSCNNLTDHVNTCRAKLIRSVYDNIFSKCRAYQALASLNNYKAPQQANGDSYPSFDGKIQCKKTTELTADYQGHNSGCYELVDIYNVTIAGEMVADTSLQVKDTLDMSNAQLKVQTATITSSGDAQMASLDAAKDVASGKSSTEAIRAGTQGAKFTAMLVAASSLRNASNVHEACNEYNKGCCQYGAYLFGDSIFINQGAKSVVLREMLKAGGKTVASMFLSDAYNKQSEALDDAKNSLAKVNTATDPGYTFVGLPGTNNSGTLPGSGETLTYSGDGVGGSQLILGGMSNSDYNFNKSAANSGKTNTPGANTATSPQNKTLLQALARDASASGGGLEKIPAGATFGTGAAGGAGGAMAAGGAGGGGGGSGPGLSKDPAASSITEDSKKLDINKSTIGYGGSGSKKSMMSGATSAPKENPFASMFGAASGAKPGAPVSVRGPASEGVSMNDGKSIFDKISSRYDAIEKDSRLLEYSAP